MSSDFRQLSSFFAWQRWSCDMAGTCPHKKIHSWTCRTKSKQYKTKKKIKTIKLIPGTSTVKFVGNKFDIRDSIVNRILFSSILISLSRGRTGGLNVFAFKCSVGSVVSITTTTLASSLAHPPHAHARRLFFCSYFPCSTLSRPTPLLCYSIL